MTRCELPYEPKPQDFCVVVDPREQLPFDVSPMRSKRDTLSTGDYSVEYLENSIALERKSLPDLVSCIAGERERFERELMRLLAYPCRAVIVEAGWSDLQTGGWRSKVTSASVIGSVLSWIGQGIPFIMAGNRAMAEEYCKRMLFIAARKRWRESRAFLIAAHENAERGET